jgi:hypothetical protein
MEPNQVQNTGVKTKKPCKKVNKLRRPGRPGNKAGSILMKKNNFLNKMLKQKTQKRSARNHPNLKMNDSVKKDLMNMRKVNSINMIYAYPQKVAKRRTRN